MRNLTLLVAVLFSGHAAAQVQWLPSSGNDLTPPAIMDAGRAEAPASINTSREPANFAWVLDFDDQNARLDGLSGYSSESRQYWLDHTAGELARGIELPLSAPGALIRISVLNDARATGLSHDRVQLRMNGQALDTGKSVDFAVSGSDLQAARMPVPDDTLAFRLDESAGAGLLSLTVSSGLPPRTPVVVHVFEPGSEAVARLSVPRLHYLAGEQITLRFDLEHAGRAIEPRTIQAVLTSPDLEDTLLLESGRDTGELTARLPESLAVTPGQPWEARVYIETEAGGMKVLRDVQVAFNAAVPVARFNGDVARAAADHPAIEIGVEAAQSGRFQLSGILYGTDHSGGLRPVAMAHGAVWLEPGRHLLPLGFEDVDLGGIGAPWEIRDLRLTDQGRMGLMQRVEGVLLER